MIVRMLTLAAPLILILINCTICDDNGVMDETGSKYLLFSDTDEDGLRLQREPPWCATSSPPVCTV